MNAIRDLAQQIVRAAEGGHMATVAAMGLVLAGEILAQPAPQAQPEAIDDLHPLRCEVAAIRQARRELALRRYGDALFVGANLHILRMAVRRAQTHRETMRRLLVPTGHPDYHHRYDAYEASIRAYERAWQEYRAARERAGLDAEGDE